CAKNPSTTGEAIDGPILDTNTRTFTRTEQRSLSGFALPRCQPSGRMAKCSHEVGERALGRRSAVTRDVVPLLAATRQATHKLTPQLPAELTTELPRGRTVPGLFRCGHPRE